MAKIYRMGAEAAPGVFHSPGNTDIIPSATPPPPPPPPPSGLLKFGTTLFGQSFARYKEPTLTGGLGTRYAAVENDTTATVGGTLYHGSAVIRIYNNDFTGPGTWADAHPAYFRADQPVVYSWRWGSTAAQQIATTQATVKADMRTFLNSKPTNSPFAWLIAFHEPDNDWKANAGVFTAWANWQVWIREVLDEPAYASRTDIRFGMCTTGGPWGGSLNPNTTTGTKGWRAIYDGVNAVRGPGGGATNRTDTWDFLGMDRYNPGWNGAVRYMEYANWGTRMEQMHSETGKPAVIGECGTPRANSFASGTTIAQRDIERAAYWRTMCDSLLAAGFYDVACWWRVPALTKGGGISGEFSTVMITPTGYNAALVAAGFTPPLGGTDAQAVVDVHSEYCINSALTANPQISLQ